jgi:hypothetical protein
MESKLETEVPLLTDILRLSNNTRSEDFGSEALDRFTIDRGAGKRKNTRENILLASTIIQTTLLLLILGCFLVLIVAGWKGYVYISGLNLNLPNESLWCFVVKLLERSCPHPPMILDLEN